MLKKLGNKLLVIHKEIQPIIHQEIQPIVTTQIQPIINEKIQPVIFSEGDPNIEEAILQLKQPKNKEIRVEDLPDVDIKDLNLEGLEIQHYIMREEQHVTNKIVQPLIKNESKYIEKIRYVPMIKYKNGIIAPYDAKNQNQFIGSNAEKMETIIAVNFTSLDQKINYPMACKKTDIFENIVVKLYNEFPNLKNKKIYFIANGNVVNRSLTFEQNKIKNGSTILIRENEFSNSYYA